MSVKMEVWGETACFTRPEMKAERVSYDVPTPSAARGMLESVYYHPGLKWHIDRIWVLKPIRFTTLRRNEVKSKILGSAILTEANGKGASCIDRSADIMQRAALMLRDVHYVIEAHFTMTDQAIPQITRASSRTSSSAGCARVNATVSPIWGAGNAPLISACGRGRRSLPSRRPGTWATCCMIWITQTQKTFSPCSSGRRWSTA